MEPYPGLQLEAVRTAQFTGGLDAFVDVLVGDTNEEATAAANQMGGFGISYRRGDSRVYLQAIGEDEAVGLPSCYFYLAGAEHRAALAGLDSVVNLELVDTRVEHSPDGWCGPNTAYNNWVHPYTYDGEVMGAPIDSEGKALDLRVSHDLGSYQIDWGLGHYTINDANNVRNRLSSRRVSGPVAHIGVGTEIRELQVGGRISYQGFDLDKASIAEGVSFSLFAERQF